jgi:tetratricopeptide (TPR) repeat protein
MARARRANFDLAEAHTYFAAQCFNAAWDLIDKPDRTAADDRLMEALNQASIYHWINRPDVTDKNLSVGYWQASRIQSLIGNWREALRHAETSLGYSHEQPPFLLGYAHEALARALFGLGRETEATAHLETAAAYAQQVKDKHDRDLLLADLAAIRAGR